jgi:hypothetical protein
MAAIVVPFCSRMSRRRQARTTSTTRVGGRWPSSLLALGDRVGRSTEEGLASLQVEGMLGVAADKLGQSISTPSAPSAPAVVPRAKRSRVVLAHSSSLGRGSPASLRFSRHRPFFVRLRTSPAVGPVFTIGPPVLLGLGMVNLSPRCRQQRGGHRSKCFANQEVLPPRLVRGATAGGAVANRHHERREGQRGHGAWLSSALIMWHLKNRIGPQYRKMCP